MNKIVRLKLGIDPNRLTKIDLSTEEGLKYLKEKLLEETTEVLEAETKKEICEELADVLEVIYTFFEAGYPEYLVNSFKTFKLKESGSFIETEYTSPEHTNYAYVLDKE